MITKQDILNATSYSDIFTDKSSFKKEYTQLMLRFHPDKYNESDAIIISSKLNQLYSEAKDHFKDGTWGQVGSTLEIGKTQSSTMKIVYRYSFENEVGMVYVGDNNVVYEFDEEKYYNRYLDAVNSIKYKDKKMEDYFARFLPVITDNFKSYNDKHYIVLSKTPDVFPLNLVADIFTRKEHAAWVMTRLLNMCMLLYVNGFVHNGICIDSCFVSLEHHGLSLLGGWQFACPNGVKMIGTSMEIFSNLPNDIQKEKIAKYIVDIESSKMVVKNLLKGNTYLNLEKICGTYMAKFLMNTKRTDSTITTSGWHSYVDNEKERTPLDELRDWEKARSKTFPKHEFIKIEGFTSDVVYKGKD